MEAIQVGEYGSRAVLRRVDLPDPSPGPGEILVRQEAAGVNFIDVYHRSGLYPLPLPFVPGIEGAGVVERVGEGVKSVEPGERVAYAYIQGTYAPLVVLPAERAVKLPEAVSCRLGAAAIIQGLTAHYLTHTTFPLEAGHSCLIHAAAGGTGQLLVQAARLRGARVLATVSGPEKAKIAREAGADEVIDYSREDFAAAVREKTGGQGVDVVYDAVGRATLAGSLDCLKTRGLLVSFGQASGRTEPVDLDVTRARGSLYITRPTLRHHIQAGELQERAAVLFGWLGSGKMAVRISHTFDLKEAAEAQRVLEERRSLGKVLLVF